MPVYPKLPTIKLGTTPEPVLRALFQPLGITSILDVGAGHGGVYDVGYHDAQPYLRRVACDFVWIRPMESAWEQKLGVDVQKLTDHYEPKSFDMVQCLEVLEHVPNSREALKQLCAVAKKFVLITSADEMHHGYSAEGVWDPNSEQAALEKLNPSQAYIKQPSVEDLLDLGFEVRVNAETRRQIIAWRVM